MKGYQLSLGLLRVAAAIGSVAALTACPSTKPPELPPTQTLPDKFLVIDWPEGERTALESEAKQGIVAIKFDGKQISVLSGCRLPGSYAYSVGWGPSNDSYVLKDSHNIGARLPLHVVTLEGLYETNQKLAVKTVVVGEYAAPTQATRFDLGPECERKGANYLVTAISVGAFELEAVASEKAEATLGWRDLGANAASDTTRRLLRSGGNHKKCQSTSDAEAPPAECSSAVRIEITELRDPDTISSGETLDGAWSGVGNTEIPEEQDKPWTMKLKIASPPVVGRCADVEYQREGDEPCSGYWVCQDVNSSRTMLRGEEVLEKKADWCESNSKVVMTVRGTGAASITYRGHMTDRADVTRAGN